MPSEFPFRRIAFWIFLFILPTLLLCGVEIFNKTLIPSALASIPDSASLREAMDRQVARSLRDRVVRNPSRLRKLRSEQIVSMLNEPDLERAEGEYRHWQYISSQCVLNIYLKSPDAMGDVPSRPVQHVDFQPRHKAHTLPVGEKSESVDKRKCMASLMSQ
jgi:hypothetical protein